MKKQSKFTKNVWYDYGPLLSYKALLNILIGVRGGGKTYGAKKLVIRDFLRNGWQFIWCRRFDTELKEAKKGWSSAIEKDEDLKKEFGNIKYEVVGDTIYINDKVAGRFIPLSISSKFKSVEFPDTRTIIFDEFIIESGSLHYLQGEVTQLFNLMETVFRHRDNNNRVILIGNAVRFTNPYFIHFRVKPFNTEFLHLKDKSTVIQLYYSEDFKDLKDDTRFGKLISETDYYNYAIMNQFTDDTDKFIERKTNVAIHRCNVTYEGVQFGFWLDKQKGIMYASQKVDPYARHNYSLSEKDHDINYYLIKNIRGTLLQEVFDLYKIGSLRFENIVVKSMVTQMLMLFF